MMRLRNWVASFSASDKIAILALIIAIPATMDLLARWFSAPSLEIIPPSYVEFRANIPSQAKRNDGVLLAHPDGDRAIDANKSMAQHLHAVIPVTFRNTGYEGSELSILEERLIVRSTTDKTKEFVFTAVFNTEIVPADSAHWWWGNVRPWLPVVMDGSESRSSEVILRAQSCPSDCRWETFLQNLKDQPETFDVTLEIKLLTDEVYSSAKCALNPTAVLASNDDQQPDRKRFYRRDGKCELSKL